MALFVIIAGIPEKVLQIRVLLDLKRGLLIGIAVLRLNDAGAQSQTQRLGHIPFAVGKQSGVPLLNLQPRDRLCFLYPTVSFLYSITIPEFVRYWNSYIIYHCPKQSVSLLISNVRLFIHRKNTYGSRNTCLAMFT